MKGQRLPRVLEKYELESLKDELVEKWTRKDESERSSTRELADLVNERICVEVMREADGTPPTNAIDDLVDILQVLLKRERSDESIETEWDEWRMGEVKAWFDQETEVGWEQTAKDFVSYSLVYSYLTNIRGAKSTDTKSEVQTPEERKTLVIENTERSTQTAKTTASWGIKNLYENECLPRDDYNISVSVEVECPDCLQTMSIYEVIEQEGCPRCSNSITSS